MATLLLVAVGVAAGAGAWLIVRGSVFGLVADVLVGVSGAVIASRVLHELRPAPQVVGDGLDLVVAGCGAVVVLAALHAYRFSGGARRGNVAR
jgi:uncharacterized membrane protein YeaQ/YmgE (transglycosylase-associated protein family)